MNEALRNQSSEGHACEWVQEIHVKGKGVNGLLAAGCWLRSPRYYFRETGEDETCIDQMSR